MGRTEGGKDMLIDHVPEIVAGILKAHAEGLAFGLKKGFELARKYPDAENIQEAINKIE